MTSRMSTSIRRPGLLAAEAGEVADDLPGPAALRLDERDFGERVGRQARLALEQLHGAEDRLQRVVELVGDAGHEQAHGGQALLPDDLPLQRLQHLAHLALLFELPIERLARVAETERHLDERILHLAELEVGRQAHCAAATGRRPAIRRAASRSCVRSRDESAAPATAPSSNSKNVETDRITMFRR